MISLDFDATSCYDRIVESIASIAARSYGQNRSLCFIHARHLREAKYLLKTKLGISESAFQHCKLYPVYGTGQGSSASPTIWVLISCRLFEIQDIYSTGASFESPTGKYKIQVHCIGFVDDTYSTVNKFSNINSTIGELLEIAQADA